MSEAAIVLGDQLFPRAQRTPLGGLPVFMAEDTELCSRYRFHKHKVIFFLSAMRHYADELRAQGVAVDYRRLSAESRENASYEQGLLEFCRSRALSTLHIFEVEDHFFEQRLKAFSQKHGIQLMVHPSPMFTCSRESFAQYLQGQKKPFMKTFYEEQRKRLGILLEDNGAPVGGQWSFDTENRKKLPKSVSIPEFPASTIDDQTREVMALCDALFGSHPGESAQFWLPVTRRDALHWMQRFFAERFHSFGEYQDALSTRAPFLFHSVLSPFINCGLITPHEVVEAALAHAAEHTVPLPALEGFIRQIIGWREFVRGIYHNYSARMEQENFFGHERALSRAWYTGETGIAPLDYSIQKSVQFGYAHHIERLMVLSNLMLLSEVHPREVYRWFMEMYVDSADWVMAANVYGMGQFSEGGIFATKPYICGSNYLLKMGDFPKGSWCDTVDGLYWSFIEKHKKFFTANPRLSMMARTLEKMKHERKEHIFCAAQEFRDAFCPMSSAL